MTSEKKLFIRSVSLRTFDRQSRCGYWFGSCRLGTFTPLPPPKKKSYSNKCIVERLDLPQDEIKVCLASLVNFVLQRSPIPPCSQKPKPVEPDVKKVRIDERRSLKEKVREDREETNGGGGDDQEMVYEEIMADATREETAKYAIVLSEINRKLCVVNPVF